MRAKYDCYVHEFTDSQGRTRYAVGEWDQERAQYYRPLDQRTCKLTGCTGEFTRRVEEWGGYLTKRQALQRARYLFNTQYGEE